MSTLFARPRRPRHGSQPGPAMPNEDTETIGAIPAGELRPAPVWTPCPPRDTQPIAVVQPIPAVPGAHARPVRRHAPEILTLLQRTRDGLLNLPPAPAPVTSQPTAVLVPSRPAPEPEPLSGAEQFAADMRMGRRGGLPVFRWAVRTYGWCGLDGNEAPAGWAWWTTERWARQDAAVIAAQTEAARAEMRRDVDERVRRAAWDRAGADYFRAIGYPRRTL